MPLDNRLLGTCEEMLTRAERGEWRRVAELEEKRKQLITQYFATPTADWDGAMRETLSRMIKLNRELVEVTIAARTNVSQQAQRVIKGKRALSGYHQVSSRSSV